MIAGQHHDIGSRDVKEQAIGETPDLARRTPTCTAGKKKRRLRKQLNNSVDLRLELAAEARALRLIPLPG